MSVESVELDVYGTRYFCDVMRMHLRGDTLTLRYNCTGDTPMGTRTESYFLDIDIGDEVTGVEVKLKEMLGGR